jgi:hypothetical protein
LGRETRHRQAFYLAEAGMALQLHRERYFDTARGPGDPTAAQLALDTIRFFLDSSLTPPDVAVNRERAFLEIRSSAAVGPETVTVMARFGRALDRDMFGAALTLANDANMIPFRPDPSGPPRTS